MATFQEQFVDTVCCRKKALFPDPYNFNFNVKNSPPENKQFFQSNFVKTSKYTMFNFLFKSLFLQFKRIANVYFLVVAILLSIDAISPVNPLSAWAPLLIVIAISMTRQGYEDYQRYKSDKQLNYKSFANVIRSGKKQKITWSEVLVGDICYVTRQQVFPADLILLSSNFETGAAFIETASLDGQKNLKPRNSQASTRDSNTFEKILQLQGTYQGELPNKQLHQFSAKILINGKNIVIQGDKQLLYRGTKLKNTQFIYGLVIYTGRNSKIMMNSDSQSQKMSQVQVKVNYILGVILAIQIFFSFIVAIFYGVFRNQNKQNFDYVDWYTQNAALDAFLMFLTYFVLINTMIPISLIVSIQIVKLFQKKFIDEDKFMFSQWRNIGCNVRSASLNQQLGQIQYIFSDKTGTLTKNIMEFKIAVIQRQMYGDLALIAPKGSASPQDSVGFKDDGLKLLLKQESKDVQLKDPLIIKNGQGKQQLKLKSLRQVAQNYFIALSVAHEVVAQKNKQGKTIYQGPSPDQITLVDAAKEMSYQFLSNTQSTTTVKIHGKEKTFDLLQVFPFTSDRKRMSVVIRDKEDGLIKMYSKGADNIIKERLAVESKLKLDDQLTKFSTIGLRTLLIAMRVLSDTQYSNFKKNRQNLPATNREKPLQQLQSKLQTNLYLIGATAVLDRLQDQVPQTIRDLIRANIKVWMLTGDKMQTAQNIAKSCNLIQPHFNVLRFQPPKNQKAKIKSHVLQNKKTKTSKPYGTQKQNVQASNMTKLQDNPSQVRMLSQNSFETYLQDLVDEAKQLTQLGLPKALLIEGSDLTPILATEQNQIKLAQLAQNCEAVVCCRLLPIQKANVVSVVRKHLNKITLSIGDGANDVPMIKTAHIGIGLYGQQGMGAVQASDYALPEFRMLWRLLLVHGRWNYIRISQMILYFFYKNMLFTIPQLLTAFFCGYSGQSVFDDIYITLYNLVFTALPLMVRAILQQDVNYIFKQKPGYQQFPQIAGKSMISQAQYLPEKYQINKYFYRLFPKIYFIGQENCIFNYKNYFAWIIEGMLEATLITTFCFFIIGNTSLHQGGISSDFWIVGLTIYSCVILVVTIKLSTHTRFWSVLLFLTIIFLSLGLYVAYMWISNYALSTNILGTTETAYETGQTFLVVLFTICLILFIDGFVIFMDFRNGSYASKMRQVVYKQQINNRQYFDEVSLTITSGLTVSQAGKSPKSKIKV